MVVEKIVQKTQAILDFENIPNRCPGCRKLDSQIIPIVAFRILLKAYATYKNFVQSIPTLEHPMDTFINAFNLLSPEERGNCSIDGEELLLKRGEKAFRFSIT